MLNTALCLVGILACSGCSHSYIVRNGVGTRPLELQVEPLRDRDVTISDAWVPERVELEADGHSYSIEGVRDYVATAMTAMVQGLCKSAKVGDDGGYFVLVPTVEMTMHTNGLADHVCSATTKVAIRDAQGRKVAAGGSSETAFFAVMDEGGASCEEALIKSSKMATRKSLEDLNRSGAGLLSDADSD
jgi:hypothetical protein